MRDLKYLTVLMYQTFARSDKILTPLNLTYYNCNQLVPGFHLALAEQTCLLLTSLCQPGWKWGLVNYYTSAGTDEVYRHNHPAKDYSHNSACCESSN